MDDSGDITAAGRLRILRNEFLASGGGSTHPGRTATVTEASTPIRLGVYDYMKQAVDEVVATTGQLRAGEPPTAQPPAEATDIYRWMVEETAHLDVTRQLAREALIYRQGLEHAILMGDHKAVRPHPCPACATWGLQWDDDNQVVACLNRRCTTTDGEPTTWTLREIARAHIDRKNHVAARAT
ncbi:hypothetical protein [Streptomyces cinereoruber]|uniref:hypothetical protein n=1 Tax=Streptomyces cinereoruber TaxID=67260 RepID=UPI003631ED2E